MSSVFKDHGKRQWMKCWYGAVEPSPPRRISSLRSSHTKGTSPSPTKRQIQDQSTSARDGSYACFPRGRNFTSNGFLSHWIQLAWSSQSSHSGESCRSKLHSMRARMRRISRYARLFRCYRCWSSKSERRAEEKDGL